MSVCVVVVVVVVVVVIFVDSNSVGVVTFEK